MSKNLTQVLSNLRQPFFSQYSPIRRGVLATLLTISLTACDSGSSNSGGDQSALNCVFFALAKKENKKFRHTILNSCDKTIQVMEKDTQQRFGIPPNRTIEVLLATATPNLAACFDPRQPRIEDDGKFVCKKP